MPTSYHYGHRKELQVAEFLEHKGFSWDRSPVQSGVTSSIVVWERLGGQIEF